MGKVIDAAARFRAKQMHVAARKMRRESQADLDAIPHDPREVVAMGTAPLNSILDPHWQCPQAKWSGITHRPKPSGERCSRCGGYIREHSLAWRWYCCESVYCWACHMTVMEKP